MVDYLQSYLVSVSDPKPTPVWSLSVSCAILKAIRAGVGFGSGTETKSYHTHIPVSSFGTKKMQRKRVPLCVYMAAGGIKGLTYLEACACFSVHSEIR